MTVFTAIFQLLLIALAAGIFVKKKVVTEAQIEALSSLTVKIFLPCLIISKTISQFDPEAFALWWVLPLAGILLILIGLLFSGMLFRMNPDKMPLMPISSIQNGIYIILPIGKVLFSDSFDTFAIYCFLLILGLTPIMWSVGKVMLSGDRTQRVHLKDFMTPPFIVTLISVFAVLTGFSEWIPGSILISVDLLGQATVPLAIFILGATIGSISLHRLPPIGDIIIVSVVKFILVPGAAFFTLYLGGFYLSMPLVCAVVLIQATSPPAANLVVIVQHYGGDTQAISSMMLIQYLIAILAMPLWIAAWQYATV